MSNALTKKKILVAPLDWGLGHATRCIPLINEFLKQGCDVQIASSGDALTLLKEEFPSLKFHKLASYDVKYSASIPFLLKIVIQVPKFMKRIKKEHRQLEEIVREEQIDFVISDSRYGCWSENSKSIFISHQLSLKVPFFTSIINKLHQKAIERFTECWVPDEEGNKSLAGELAINLNINSKNIGLLSRMTRYQAASRYEILAIISGPEPQRTFFEAIVLRELKTCKMKSLIVRGLPGNNEKKVIEQLTIVNHLPSREMNEVILESDLVISRSGYSTIMDLAVLGKRAVFVPTPGQPEQEYLADQLMKNGIAFSIRQDNFNLQQALLEEKKFKGFERGGENIELSGAIKQLLDESN